MAAYREPAFFKSWLQAKVGWLVAFLAILVAVILREIAGSSSSLTIATLASLGRVFIYLTLFIVWSLSLN